MKKELRDMGDNVNDYICKARAQLSGYNFYTGNKEGIADQSTIDAIRDLLRDAEMLSRQLIGPR